MLRWASWSDDIWCFLRRIVHCTCIKQYGVYELLHFQKPPQRSPFVTSSCMFSFPFYTNNLFIRFSYFTKFSIKTIFLRGFLNIVLQFYYNDIYRISHLLRLDMIFIQRVVCFLSPSLGEGYRNKQRVGWKSYLTKNHMRFLLSHILQSFYCYFSFSNYHTDCTCRTTYSMFVINNITPRHKLRSIQLKLKVYFSTYIG